MNTLRHRGLSWTTFVSTLALAAAFAGRPATAQVGPLAPAQGSEEVDALNEDAAQPTVRKTVAVIAGARYDELIKDVTHIGSLVGQPKIAETIEDSIARFTNGKGLDALDKTRPWGVIVQTDGAQFLPIGCLPVAKPDVLLEFAAAHGAEIKEGADGIKELSLPNVPRSVFVKQHDGWTFICASAQSLAKLPENPQGVLTQLLGEYDVAATLSAQNVPEMYRQFAILALQSGVQQGMQRQPDESDEQYEIRQKLTQSQMEQMVRMVNELDSVTIGWAVDAGQQRAYLDFTQLFLPDGKMAQQIAAYGQPRTNFAGFYQPDAAATMTFATKADPELIQNDIAQIDTMMRMMRQQFNKAIDDQEQIDDVEARDAIKAAFSDWFDAFEATIKAGHLDGGMALNLSPESLTFVAGALVKEPGKIESGLKKLESAAEKSDRFPGIKWNAASHAGVNFHTLSVPVPEAQEGPRKLLGSEVEIAIGIGRETVYLAVGHDHLSAIKWAIDASASEPEKAVPPFELAVSLRPIMDVAAAQAAEGEHQAMVQLVADMLRNEAPGRDHLRAVGQLVPNGVRYRFEAEEGVLRAIGIGAAEAKRKQ